MYFDERLSITCTAPTNIAVIKYWGKDSVALNTPINSSVSVTLHQDDLCAITTAAASKTFSKDRLWLNGVEEDVAGNARLAIVLKLIRAIASDKVDDRTGEVLVKKEDWKNFKVHISSRNTFPTAAGLASSAAGYACLTYALAKLYSVVETYPGELTAIARQGSGSACRSLYGGFVKWQKGSLPDAKDSIAIQVADEHHWPELRALILVVSAAKKETSSTSGMATSVQTSDLLKYRAAEIVEPRLSAIESAYRSRDFAAFGRITMKDSNQFHATCLDTYPPIFYMNDTSKSIVQLVHAFNRYHSCVRAAYTFDAGPNAVIYTTEEDVPQLLAFVTAAYPPPMNSDPDVYCSDADLASAAKKQRLPTALASIASAAGGAPGDIQYIYATRAGGGPQVVGPEMRLLDPATGLNTWHPRAVTTASEEKKWWSEPAVRLFFLAAGAFAMAMAKRK